MPTRPVMSPGDWLLLVVLSILWGGSFFFAKIAVDELPPLTVALARVALAAALLLAAMRIMGVALPRRETWSAFAVMGLINNVIPFTLIFWGQTHIASGLASILNATTPLFTVLVAHVATADEKVTPTRLAGVTVGFLGVVVMIGPDALGTLGGALLAQLACLVAAFFYALGGIWGRRFRGEASMAVAAGQMSASTLMLLPLVLLVDRPWTLPAPSPAAVGAVVALAAVSTALAYVIYFRILARAGATNLLLVTFLIPVSAILLGVGLLGETLAARHLAGMVGIALGLAAIDGRPLRWLRRA
jgi:drug/metabolite transporter (DMT)-like permease